MRETTRIERRIGFLGETSEGMVFSARIEDRRRSFKALKRVTGAQKDEGRSADLAISPLRHAIKRLSGPESAVPGSIDFSL